MHGRTMDKNSPRVQQDFVPFGATAQKDPFSIICFPFFIKKDPFSIICFPFFISGLMFPLKAILGLKSALPDLISALRTNGRMNESPPVFYRTSSPSGLLPCFPSLKFIIMQSRATGIADHILPLGDWLALKFCYLRLEICPRGTEI